MPSRAPVWEGLTPEEHEFHYNPQRAVPDFAACQARRQAPNARARAELKQHLDVAYGVGLLHKLDIYPAAGAEPAPVHMFLHGGYWRAQDKQNFAFIAAPLVERGITAAIVNYELCPAATLDGVVNSALAAIAWTAANIARFGGDPRRLTLSGHSAGAHLAAAAVATDWTARGLPADLIKGIVPISGIFDPTPAQWTTVNAEIRLTPELARRHDYERAPPRTRSPARILAGAKEPWQWIDQSLRYAAHLHGLGHDVGVAISPGCHHFDIIDQYLDPASDVMRAVLALAKP